MLPNTKRVTAAIIKKDNKILITQRAEDDNLSLKWEFPGGKVENSETPEECLKREIKEELNLDIEVKAHFATSIYKYAAGEIELMAYLAEISGGKIQLNVHNNARWVEINELNSYEFCPADVELVKRIVIN